jgi:tRNA(fMet)-specific endonuclease VapC
MTRGYLVDTNHLSRALEPVSRLRDHLRQARRSGLVLGTCVPVLCELEVGIQQTDQIEDNRRALRALLRFIRVWPLEPAFASAYGEIYVDLRGRGRVLSQVDMMLAALARERGLILLTADRDFEALPWLRTENWLAAPPAPSGPAGAPP